MEALRFPATLLPYNFAVEDSSRQINPATGSIIGQISEVLLIDQHVRCIIFLSRLRYGSCF